MIQQYLVTYQILLVWVVIYLQGILKDRTAYEIEDNGSDLVITFKEGIALEPNDIVANDFLVRGKIVSR